MNTLEHTIRLIAASQRIVVFTGAGISTASGIPDFRGNGGGIWNQHNPAVVASQTGFRRNPAAFYEWISPLANLIFDASPNNAHRAVTSLRDLVKHLHVITQNIDGLHQKSGVEHTIELHGQLSTAVCTHCRENYPTQPLLQAYIATGCIPACSCQPNGAVIKPNVILYGEQLPYRTLRAARDLMRNTDLVIVVGSSLYVEPACELPQVALKNGARLIIINQKPTPADKYADIVLHGDANVILPEIVNRLET